MIKGELRAAADLIRRHGVGTPALLVIGEVTRAAANRRAQLEAAAE